jgi:hypothetical protein
MTSSNRWLRFVIYLRFMSSLCATNNLQSHAFAVFSSAPDYYWIILVRPIRLEVRSRADEGEGDFFRRINSSIGTGRPNR